MALVVTVVGDCGFCTIIGDCEGFCTVIGDCEGFCTIIGD